MSLVAELLRSRRVPQVAALALVSAGLAGCSADSARFAENPFASQRQQETTGAVNNRAQSAPMGRVESRPMPQYQSQALPPPTMPAQGYNQNYQHSQPQQPAYQPPQQPYRSSAVNSGGRTVPSYQPPQAPAMETTGSATPRSVAAAGGTFSAADGQSVIVGTNDTVDTLAARYNVPSREIMRANGLPTPRSLQPGQQVVIPRRMAPAAVAAAPAPAPSRPATVAAAQPTGTGFHAVRSGETLNSIARKNNIPVTTLAKANNLTTSSQLKIGSRIVVPGMRMASAPVAAQGKPAAPVQVAGAKPAPLGATQKPAAVAAAPTAPVVVASAAPVEKVRVATETKEVEKEAKQADATGGLPSFRWPVRGRVIAAYGAKTSGKQNDGINVAVPEGTPIKAAEDGVVTYAGSELKGYGNLVLVRHSNGYVTAYDRASELAVKRGETIKRGQTLGKAGQTGDVSSPQVHFEIRQGSSPVDPTKFLNGA
jgi:murein DD-endopeptidase MepM/ murein hydrolase activator NlpD